MTSLQQESQTQYDAVNALLNEGEFAKAEMQLKKLLAQNPECVRYYELLGGALRGQGRQLEMVPILSAASKAHPDLPLWRGSDYRERQAEAIAKELPSVFLNTQFKSGSVFLRGALEKGLGLGWQFLFPEGVVHRMVDRWVADFKLGGAVCQDHRVWGNELRDALETMPNIKFVLHLRDPRQSQLSVVHHYERMLRDGPDYARRNLIRLMPDGYENWTFEERMDLQLGLREGFDDKHMTRAYQNFEGQIVWIETWLEAIETGACPNDIAITDYQDLANGQVNYMEGLLEKIGVNADLYDFSVIENRPEPGTAHYRKGDPNEWRSVLTDRQQARTAELMTGRVYERYGN